MTIAFEWDDEKDAELRRTRGVGFEMVLEAIADGGLVSVLRHPVRTHQQIMVVRLDGYIHLVPFVSDGPRRFLTTIYPSRKFNRIYGDERT
jgi:uncharacterized DUF497 family protein